MPAGYKLQVVPAEYHAGGPFHRLTTWLDAHMHAFGFFRPYTTDRGGVSPEPWHLSYAPVAKRAQAAFSRGQAARGAGGQRDRREGGSAGGARPQLRDLRGQRGRGAGGGALLSRLTARVEAQPQTFLMAPSISVRVVAMESSTPVNTGG